MMQKGKSSELLAERLCDFRQIHVWILLEVFLQFLQRLLVGFIQDFLLLFLQESGIPPALFVISLKFPWDFFRFFRKLLKDSREFLQKYLHLHLPGIPAGIHLEKKNSPRCPLQILPGIPPEIHPRIHTGILQELSKTLHQEFFQGFLQLIFEEIVPGLSPGTHTRICLGIPLRIPPEIYPRCPTEILPVISP